MRAKKSQETITHKSCINWKLKSLKKSAGNVFKVNKNKTKIEIIDEKITLNEQYIIECCSNS
jgi:hypothetical protein